MDKLGPTNYKGSIATYLSVREQIRDRWGEEAAKQYDPFRNARTFGEWRAAGFRVKKGERSLKSITFIPVEDERGEVVDAYKRTVNLFFFKQLERVLS